MKEQFYLSMHDLWNRKKNVLSLLLQMTLTFLLIQFIFNAVFELQNLRQEVGRLTEVQDMYFLLDVSTTEQFFQAFEPENIEKVISFFEFIFENESFKALPLQTNTFLPPDERFDAFEGNMGSTMSFMYATSLLEALFDLNTISGRFFNETDYVNHYDYIPVVLGFDFMDAFEVGDIFEDSFHGYLENFKVIGFLEQNSTYVDLMSSWHFQSLDRVMLRPLNQNHSLDVSYFLIPLSKIYVIPESTDQMREIVTYSDELGLFSFMFRNMNDQLELLSEERMMWIQSQLFLTGLITILTLVSFTISLLQFIDKKRHEFGIHYLVGARNKDISFRIAFQVIPFLIVGSLIRIGLLNQMDYGWLTMGISLLLSILICLIPLVRMSNLNLSALIRWRIT
ncbi:MAG: hypothetical protein FWG67_02330 [Defluviitaleaceae bacterium]|nr:hypothetical protein [Defluviitaleaceae bacterium]